MGELVWEWVLASGETIVARVDAATNVESVYVGQRLASRSGYGGKPEGHVVTLGSADQASYRQGAPQEIVLTFDAPLCNFMLRSNGQLVTPSRAPTTPASPARPGQVFASLPPRAPSMAPALLERGGPNWGLRFVVFAIAVAIAGSVFAVRRYVRNAKATSSAGSITASNALLTVNYPANFKAKDKRRELGLNALTCARGHSAGRNSLSTLA